MSAVRIAFVAAAGVGLLLYLRQKGVRGSLGAYVVKNCKCYRVDYASDGSTKSTQVPLEKCLETNSAELAGCPGMSDSNAADAGGEGFLATMNNYLDSVFAGASASIPTFESVGKKTTDGGV